MERLRAGKLASSSCPAAAIMRDIASGGAVVGVSIKRDLDSGLSIAGRHKRGQHAEERSHCKG